MKISFYSITALVIQLSITFLHHERNPEAVAQECFMKISVLKKCSENSHIQHLWEDSFVEPEAERETTGFSL